MQEQWKTINGYPNYQISNLGRVKRIEHYIERPTGRNKNMKMKCYYEERIKNKFFKGGNTKSYYCTKLIDSKGKLRTVCIHRLVAEAFVDNPRGLNEVDHIDRNSFNNRADNLRWCTRSENIRNRGKLKHSEEFYRNHPNYKRKD